MIQRQDATRQAARQLSPSRPEPPGYLARTDSELRRERIATLVDAIHRTRPAWSRLPPWEIEHLLERGAEKQQRELFADGGAA